MLLSAFVFLLLIFWMIKIISSGKLSFVWNRLTLSIILLLFVLGISTFFSTSKTQSFWGMSFEPDTFFSFILYILVFFFFSNLISKNQLSPALISFLASSGILVLLFLIQIFRSVFPWDFAKISGFNLIGSVQSLAVFLGGAFVILIGIISGNPLSPVTIRGKVISKKVIQGLAGLLGILLFLAIFLINFWVVWLGIVFCMAIIIFNKLKNLSATTLPTAITNPLKPLFLPLFIFVLALVFIFLKLPIGNIVSLPAEISPTYKATFDISIKTLKEGAKNFVLGSGPATFGYQYSLHRGTGPNLTDFWQFRFDQGAAALPTFLAEWGISGALIILLMMIIFFYQGFKNISPVFVGGFYFLISWVFYSVNLSLLFAVFLMMGLWQASFGPRKEFSFTQSPQKAFFTMLVCVILIVGSILGLYSVSQKYYAAAIYTKGLNLINAKEPKLDEGIVKINKACQLDPKDIYFRNLSQAFLLKINEVLNNQNLSQEQKQTELQKQISNAEISANNAILINSKNSQNWLQLGNVYENFASINVTGAAELAISNYQKAADLDPQNPQILLNIGRVYKLTAETIRVQISLLEVAEKKDEEKIKELKETLNKTLEAALKYFEKSKELKPNFSAAYYLAAQTYEIKGEKQKALENYQIVLQLEPNNEDVKKKIDELTK